MSEKISSIEGQIKACSTCGHMERSGSTDCVEMFIADYACSVHQLGQQVCLLAVAQRYSLTQRQQETIKKLEEECIKILATGSEHDQNDLRLLKEWGCAAGYHTKDPLLEKYRQQTAGNRKHHEPTDKNSSQENHGGDESKSPQNSESKTGKRNVFTNLLHTVRHKASDSSQQKHGSDGSKSPQNRESKTGKRNVFMRPFALFGRQKKYFRIRNRKV